MVYVRGYTRKDGTKVVNYERVSKHYPWKQCIADRRKEGYTGNSPEKICGSIKAKSKR